MTESVKALCFDVFGTVVDWRGSIIREMTEIGAAQGIDADWPAFADAWRSLYQPAMERVRSAQRAYCRLDVLHRENLQRLIEPFGLQDLDERQLDHINRIWHRLQPWPDAVEGLTRLKRQYILATVSNGNIALIVNMAKNAGLPWDVVLGAEVSGHYKPQPQAYLSAVESLGLVPAECVMVAAHNNDLQAASREGLRTAFVVRATEHGPNQTNDLQAEHEYDWIASDFNDLADKLEC